jgi:hypothetical protein
MKIFLKKKWILILRTFSKVSCDDSSAKELDGWDSILHNSKIFWTTIQYFQSKSNNFGLYTLYYIPNY